MKTVLFLLALAASLCLLPATVTAKDKRRDDDDWHKAAKQLRSDLNLLQSHYDLVRDQVQHLGGGRRQWDEMRRIQGDIDALNDQVSTGRFDLRDVRARIQQEHDDLVRVGQQVQDKGKYQRGYGGGFYRPN